MAQSMEGGMLRIFDSQKRAVGAGCLVAPGLALTCANVVARALLGTKIIPPEPPEGEISLDLPLLAPGSVLNVQVKYWNAQWDVAVLAFQAELPAEAEQPDLFEVEDVWKHPWCAFGFPEGYASGVWASGEMRGANADRQLQIIDTPGHRYFVQPGFSGGPVWDETLHGVVGMIVISDVKGGERAAFCLPIATLAWVWPGLRDFVKTPDEHLRQAYLEHLQRNYHALDFKGIPQLDTLAHELSLEEVYVPLLARPELPEGETWERRMLAGRQLERGILPEEALAALEKQAPASVRIEDAIEKHNRVVVLGDPGSGKSTLLKHLTLRLASERSGRLPILVPLNAYAAALEKEDLNLQVYLPQYFANLSAAISGLQPLFDSALAKGQALVLLDGLDEVQRERGQLVRKVEAFCEDAVRAGNKVVVTSRIVGYRDCALEAKKWALHTLLDFDEQAIEAFASQWCQAFEKSTRGNTPEAIAAAEVERQSLLAAIRANPGVRRLAANPLLLTILALIKRQRVTLPNQRARLYDLYLETLINAWSKARALDGRQVGPELDYLQTLEVLSPLALWLRQENPTAGLVTERDLIEQLTRHFMGEGWQLPRGQALERAGRFLRSVRQYSNLLLARGEGQYGFIHLTLEEMLAAYGVVQIGQVELEESLGFIQEHLVDPAWRETILLAVGIWGLVKRSPRAAGRVVRAMLDMPCAGEQPGQNVLLAGACLEYVGSSGLDRPSVEAVLVALEQMAQDRRLPPTAQRDSGFELGRLAGSNPEMLQRIRPRLDDFIPIPAGTFQYGDQKKPAMIETPFEIARYPVTNLQYRRFVEAGGYEKPVYWSKAGWGWRMGETDSQAQDDFEKRRLEARPVDRRARPAYWQDIQWNNPLAPVVGVSWYEAEAYCNWLAAETGQSVRLPTEQEWERAARGTEGRFYPWGTEFERNRLNCAEYWAGVDNLTDFDTWRKWWDGPSARSASTTVVGQFGAGNTPEGISDLSGNVWEWTISVEGRSKILRGGSWFFYRGLVRAAWRLRYVPYDWHFIGFRPARSR